MSLYALALSPSRLAITKVLWGGLVYLTLVSEHWSSVIDVDLQTRAGWGRIKTVLGCLVRPA